MYPMRRILGVVQFLHTQSDVYNRPLVPSCWHCVFEGYDFVRHTFHNIGSEAALLQLPSYPT